MSDFLTIQQLSEADRPREKLLNKGHRSLTDSELIAILIGSGNREMNAVELAKYILSQVGNDLNRLAKLNVADLMKFKGIGEAKAINIISALELGRRRKKQSIEKVKINSSHDAYDSMKPFMMDLEREEFWIIIMNRSNTILGIHQISQGGVTATVVDPRLIFKYALEQKAVSIIIAHNHPSGNINPSQSDVTLTEKLKKGGALLEIPVLDHIIFTNDGYFSFADEGLI